MKYTPTMTDSDPYLSTLLWRRHKNVISETTASENFNLYRTVSHFLLDCPHHTTLRQQFFFSLLDIPETISLNLLIFGSVNLNDEENKAVIKSVQTFIIKSKRFTPWHAHIIFFTFSILFNLFVHVLLFSSKLCSFQLHAYIHFFFSPSMYK